MRFPTRLTPLLAALLLTATACSESPASPDADLPEPASTFGDLPDEIDYVALGDSYSAGPLITTIRSDPSGCVRSTDNYPAFLAGWLSVDTYTDVTCSAAVTAQAVAARTYAAFERSHPAAPHYDLCDTSQCQVYGGADDEHPAATAAIQASAKQGLFFDGRPAFTQFSASNGGFSSAGSMPYLVAQADPYDGVANPTYTTWTATIDDTQVEKHWPAIGDLTSIEVTARDGNGEWGGRVTDMAFIGTTGTARVDGDTVRSYFGLNSEWFTFSVTPRQTGPARL